MPKRDSEQDKRTAARQPTNASNATADTVEQRVVAFAEQPGRIAGTIQAKADGWMDRQTLNKRIAGGRDGAADLLEQLAGGAAKASKKTPADEARTAEPEGGAAAWSMRPARGIVRRCRPIRTRTSRILRRPRCGRQRRSSKPTGAAGATSRRTFGTMFNQAAV
jgi:hypothetical protein